MAEFTGFLITDEQTRVLLARDTDAPTSECVYELPGIQDPDETWTGASLCRRVQMYYDLNIAPLAVSPVVIRKAGSLAVARLFKGCLQPRSRLDEDSYSFIDLRRPAGRLRELSLGPIAEIVRWQIQNDELAL